MTPHTIPTIPSILSADTFFISFDFRNDRTPRIIATTPREMLVISKVHASVIEPESEAPFIAESKLAKQPPMPHISEYNAMLIF